MAMATAMTRSGLRSSLLGGSSCLALKRGFAVSAHHDDSYEASKWQKLTYLGATACTGLGIYIFSKDHPHYEEPPAYSYLHIRSKEFPWGPDGLFEKKH